MLDSVTKLTIFSMANSEISKVCKTLGVKHKNEFFADRCYDELKLAPRNPDGVIHTIDDILEQCKKMLLDSEVIDIHGKIYSVTGETICVHGDHKNSLGVLRALVDTLALHNIRWRPNEDTGS